MQVGTRSQVKDYIKKKKVSVNGEIISKGDIKIDTNKDIVCFEGRAVGFAEYEYYMLNKPAGVVSATDDKKDKTVIDLIQDKMRKDLFPVGRLDKDTEGLLIITNDGELAHLLLSPRKHVDKTYYARVKGCINNDVVEIFKNGFKVDEELTALPADLEIISYNQNDDETEVNITIHEGKYHQIKRMFKAVNSEVIYLKRISFGPIKLDNNLSLGDYRALTESELDKLKGVIDG